MKKSFLIFASVGLILTTSSCYKTYNCDCEDSFGNKSNYLVKGTNKQEARKNCDKNDLTGHCELGARVNK